MKRIKSFAAFVCGIVLIVFGAANSEFLPRHANRCHSGRDGIRHTGRRHAAQGRAAHLLRAEYVKGQNMKLYNKKGLIFGLFWSVLGVSALVLEFVRPSGSTAVVVRDILLFSLLILFGVRQVVRAFSQPAAREDAIEERDERNKLIKLKTGSTMFKVAEAILFVWIVASTAAFALTQDTLWTMAVIVSGFTLGLLFIIELFVSIHYERKE